ncbi:MAG: DUF3119 family protein [Cyanobacteria bacterium P01_A01_bin.3]
MTASQPAAVPQEGTTLSPDFRLPAAIALLAAPLFFVSLWVCGVVELFAIFLVVQTATLRLTFTDTSLKVFRSQTEIRDFPYTDWLNWEIFWSPTAILFYFKEVKSIHFLPILFNPNELRLALQEHVPNNHF